MKYYGKEKCRILKEIRAEIARQNDIEWVVSECKHKGNCKGTCPKCEQEVRELEAALARRAALGKTVAVAGISAAISLSVTGCVNPFTETTDGVFPVQGGLLPPDTTVEDTAADTAETTYIPLEGETEAVSYETEMGEIAVPGEVPETDTSAESDPETEDLAGEPAPDWEDEDPLAGEPAE